MTEKEKIILKEIIEYYHINKSIPSLRYLKNKLNYKSHNSILQFMKSLEKKNYLIRKNNKLILNDNYDYFNKGLKIIKVLNYNQEIKIILNPNKNYLAYKIKNNNLRDYNILKNDILIIEKKNKIKNNDIGLFLINNNYEIYHYFYQDGFNILKSNQEIYLNKVTIIGKVIKIERNI